MRLLAFSTHHFSTGAVWKTAFCYRKKKDTKSCVGDSRDSPTGNQVFQLKSWIFHSKQREKIVTQFSFTLSALSPGFLTSPYTIFVYSHPPNYIALSIFHLNVNTVTKHRIKKKVSLCFTSLYAAPHYMLNNPIAKRQTLRPPMPLFWFMPQPL